LTVPLRWITFYRTRVTVGLPQFGLPHTLRHGLLHTLPCYGRSHGCVTRTPHTRYSLLHYTLGLLYVGWTHHTHTCSCYVTHVAYLHIWMPTFSRVLLFCYTRYTRLGLRTLHTTVTRYFTGYGYTFSRTHPWLPLHVYICCLRFLLLHCYMICTFTAGYLVTLYG